MKKEIIKPFDLASYKNGAKVKTRDGHEVRIICTDAKHIFYPIIALVKLNNNESTISYTLKGKVYYGVTNNDSNDLVIVEETKEPEFWSDREYKEANGYYIDFLSSIMPNCKAKYNKDAYNLFANKKLAKSALAMAMISQIMANDIDNFGGVITDEEWEDITVEKYAICRLNNAISLMCSYLDYRFLAFHTRVQRDLFIEKYYDLVKDYLMID